MNRKQFLRRTIGLGCASLLPGVILSAQAEKSAVPQYNLWELCGKSRPELLGEDFRLRRRAAEAFADMRSEARKAGISIYSQSSYRSFNHQKKIWNRKYKSFLTSGDTPEIALQKSVHDSAIPGTSRHHWGTDLDIIDAAVQPQPLERLTIKNFQMGGPYEHLAYWMAQNAERFGFVMSYIEDAKRTGFKHEPWQFSFAELSRPILRYFMTQDWKPILKDSSLLGYTLFTSHFLEEYAQEYLLGVNPKLK